MEVGTLQEESLKETLQLKSDLTLHGPRVDPDFPTKAAEKAASGKLNQDKKRKLMILGSLIAASVISYFGYHSYMYVSTDNAMIEGKSTYLSPRVGGLVTDVYVTENQDVKAGQLLVRIRQSEYQNALDEAESNRDAIEADLRAAKRNYDRTGLLLKEGASTQERMDAAEAQYHSLARRFKSAQAGVDRAKLNLSDTEIKAPADGTIAKKSVEVGMLANPGQPLFGFVASDERWATANFKETEMKGVIPGKIAEIEVDAISGRKYEGVVESVSPSTGATFSLLPPDNATGNFTKVVQRVPVRVKLVHLSAADIKALQAGLSAEVTVKLH